MNIIRIKTSWHEFWLRFNEVLLEGCLCNEEKKRIFDRIHYHKFKINA